MKFYAPPEIMCSKCKGPTKVKVLLSASEYICFDITCLHCRQTEEVVMSFWKIISCYRKAEGQSDSMLMGGTDEVQ